MKIFIRSIFFAFILGLGSAAAFGQNYKIKQTTSMSGHNMESTVYVKGSRKRTQSGGMMGVGGDVATIEQCDLKRNVQVNDKKKLYFVESTAVSEPSTAPATPGKAPVAAGKATKGGTVTHTSSIIDTGERKQMFGLTARHIKTSMTVASSPDACMKQDMRIDTDGWYVDLPLFSCPFPVTSVPRNPASPQSRGCEDRIITKSTGTGKLGFALQSTTTIISGGRDEAFTTTLETIEFSKATLDDALFDVPANYTLADSSQALYGAPDFSAMMKSGGNDDEDMSKSSLATSDPSVSKSSVPGVKKEGVKRIGVLVPANRTSESVSTDNLQEYLIQKLTVGNVEAIAVNSEADAKAANCDYILSSDISKLKQSTASKIGGVFGKVTNTDASATQRFDAQVDFKLVLLSSGQSVLQSKAASKTDGNADRAAEGVLNQEASAVLAAAK